MNDVDPVDFDRSSCGYSDLQCDDREVLTLTSDSSRLHQLHKDQSHSSVLDRQYFLNRTVAREPVPLLEILRLVQSVWPLSVATVIVADEFVVLAETARL